MDLPSIHLKYSPRLNRLAMAPIANLGRVSWDRISESTLGKIATCYLWYVRSLVRIEDWGPLRPTTPAPVVQEGWGLVRGGLVFKAHRPLFHSTLGGLICMALRPLCHSTLGLRVETKKKKKKFGSRVLGAVQKGWGLQGYLGS